jgi:hypothetical protein
MNPTTEQHTTLYISLSCTSPIPVGHKIPLIRLLREVTKCGLVDAKEIVDNLPDSPGVLPVWLLDVDRSELLNKFAEFGVTAAYQSSQKLNTQKMIKLLEETLSIAVAEKQYTRVARLATELDGLYYELRFDN